MQNFFFSPSAAVASDVLVLTKPLGTQLATNAFVWLQEKSANWIKLSESFAASDIQSAFDIAVRSMTFLNKIGAELMHKYGAHAATDVTGFGLFGHAKNLVDYQTANVDFHIHTLPLIKHLREMGLKLEQRRLLTGRGVETSGGLLIAMPANVADDFCRDFRQQSGRDAWIVGSVSNGTHQVTIAEEPTFLEIE